MKEIYLAHTQGFCAGVSYALTIVEETLKEYGAPIYINHHIVHNTAIIKDLESRGVIFIDDLNQVPIQKICIFSAHGVGPEIYQKAKNRKLKVIDATCPLVNKVHRKALEFSNQNIPVILIGHKGHQEVIGSSGYIRPELLYFLERKGDIKNINLDNNRVIAYLTQTTLSVLETKSMVSALKEKFSNLIMPYEKDICYATENRQKAVLELTKDVEILIVCGSKNSSNSVRLFETALEQGVPGLLVDSEADFDLNLIKDKIKIGISSGASVPEFLVQGLIKKIKDAYPDTKVFQEPSIEKKISFKLPLHEKTSNQ
ncbi:MAG: 4-hydroxy-3-methylbut-2-enyl diphosphate reductase [Candidatus Margulisiibacteriota bacterium]|jgi:4-hydroxy-3-methylbut-2-enyl diphosphate reductase